jgi:hypothetical protein
VLLLCLWISWGLAVLMTQQQQQQQQLMKMQQQVKPQLSRNLRSSQQLQLGC